MDDDFGGPFMGCNSQDSHVKFLIKADSVISETVSTMKGYYLKQLVTGCTDVGNIREEEINFDKYKNTVCPLCGACYGPATVKFKIIPKRKKSKKRKDKKKHNVYSGAQHITIICLRCSYKNMVPCRKSNKCRKNQNKQHASKKILFVETPRIKQERENQNNSSLVVNSAVKLLGNSILKTPDIFHDSSLLSLSRSAKKRNHTKPGSSTPLSADRSSGLKNSALLSFLGSL
ncbi:uncharacterized protein LOC130654501 [Hydractinia symbiolongicarpus]|uniref:uncharacterized protein LOC130654501 n=1 Tax=Hydractinia symbiolongicarpus TaxID=13093 RepID=UPI002549D616|nr:uncharacterized protein LOC130654501 [Hydractinia symbiolongicarpus]XP_057313077.1 uncharacterized protein LOC130654501 [Hydractinia symbiolongicarpus]XP_057313078.1 uncharacterized protein LOC130654501 [Hydractinia symbiolongicarpus]XP_057313079.1 uncharacterized protein LOC130654501 [Hydractinia symbiolongicarpus]